MRKLQLHAFSIRTTAALIITACFWLQISGCLLLLGAGAGAGGTVYVMGKLEDEIEASVPALHKATMAGLGSLDMPIVTERGDKLVSDIESKTADGKTIKIGISSLTATRSKITIRVGMVGDETRSRQILDAIKKHL